MTEEREVYWEKYKSSGIFERCDACHRQLDTDEEHVWLDYEADCKFFEIGICKPCIESMHKALGKESDEKKR